MVAYVFDTQAACIAARGLVDQAQGYPRPGTDTGAGIHVVPTFVTVTYCLGMKHPTLDEWALASDTIVDAAISGKAGIPQPVALDASWGAVSGPIDTTPVGDP